MALYIFVALVLQLSYFIIRCYVKKLLREIRNLQTECRGLLLELTLELEH